jgi:hypothetical protein
MRLRTSFVCLAVHNRARTFCQRRVTCRRTARASPLGTANGGMPHKRRSCAFEISAQRAVGSVVLLERLVAKKLEKAANAVRKEGWKWIEVRSSFDPGEWSACRRRYPERAPLPAEGQKEMDALTDEAETLAELGELDDEQQERLDSIHDRIEELDCRETV